MALASPASPESAPDGHIVEHPDNAFSRSDARDDRSLYWGDASTLSETNMVFASIWSQSCLSNHGCCDIDTKGFFPTRIVHIKGPGNLVLKDGGDVCGRYLTLSYKWGQTKRYLTSTGNVANHYASIPFGALPKTFLDAVHVTYRLGFRYLWVDALCIIHDSPEDLQKEISQMGSIYEASTITLFAEAGDDVDAGLSVLRDPHSSKPCKLDLTATFEGRTLAVSTYACYDPDSLENQPSESPLYRRGWVLQEEVLASRLLKFGSHQMNWECRHSAFWESLPTAEQPEIKSIWRPKNSALRSWIYDRIDVEQSSNRKKRETFGCWYELINNYSGRALTYTADVLPAVAGIATIASRNNQISYINGLWKEDLLVGLLWAVRVDTTNGPHPPLPNTREKPHAPSWTWLSQWGKPIEFEQLQLRYWAASYIAMVDLLDNPDDDGSKAISSQNLQPLDQTTGFQTIDTRPLALSGYLVEAVVDVGSWSPWHPDAWGRRVTTLHTQEDMGLLFPDENPFMEPLCNVICCLCLVCADKHSIALMWLALASTGQPGVYRRLGMGRHTISDGATGEDAMQDVPSFWRKGRKETFKLV